MANWEDYYAVLGVRPDASTEEIKAAFRYKANILHPDRLTGTSESFRRRAEEELKKVNLAYETLGNSRKRQEYHSEWLRKGGKTAEWQQTSVGEPPKPIVDPQHIKFHNVEPGEIRTSSFIIRNDGGPHSKIWFSNPDSWVKVINWKSLTSSNELPLAVEIEAAGEDWGKDYIEYIRVKLDEEETQVQVELKTKVKTKPAVVFCPECGHKNSEKLIICEQCEADLHPNDFQCPSCKSDLPRNSRFCRVCGTKL